jgi:uncharacterized RDD family membrane protein YckC
MESRKVSDFPSPPASGDALEQQYYLHDGTGVIGPITGHKLKEMVECGAVARTSSVNVVGAPNWIPISESAFAGFFRPGADGAPAPAAPFPGRAAPSDARYATFWIRAGAYIIDYALTILAVGVAGAIFAIASVSVFGAGPTEAFLDEKSIAVNVIGTVIALAYYAYFSAGPWQATPGKRICGIYMIRTNGKRVDAPFAVLRNFAYLVSAIPLGFGFLMVFWTDERQALHDMLMGTRVVYGKL